MKRICLFIIALCSANIWAQNLVKNASIENTGPCPIISNQIEFIAEPWLSYFGTPDYYDQKCGNPGSTATTNNALPFDGSAFVGLAMYGDTGSAYVREYLHGELKEPLDSGKFYRVTFYVKPVNNDSTGESYGINNIGMYLSKKPLDSVPDERIYKVTPQVVAKDPVIAETYWTSICGIIKAKGGERYITIGNFSDDISTQVVPLKNAANPRKAYYLVDYVEVVKNDIPQLPEDTIICVDQRIDLTINAPDVTVKWSDQSSGKNFIITEPGTYYANISTPSCSYRDSIIVKAANCNQCKIYVPNAFTPNDDGRNDVFQVFAEDNDMCELASFRMNIYDRWGKKVFESDDPEVGWDGKNIDKTGVFTYTIQYEYPFHRKTQTLIKKGTVTLIK